MPADNADNDPASMMKAPPPCDLCLQRDQSPYSLAKTTSFLVSVTPANVEVPSAHGDSGDGHGFYSQNVATLSGSRSSTTLSPTERNRKEEIGSHSSDHFAPDHSEQKWLLCNALLSLTPRQSHISTSKISFTSQPSLSEKGPVAARSLVQSWVHSSLTPLPDAISKPTWITTTNTLSPASTVRPLSNNNYLHQGCGHHCPATCVDTMMMTWTMDLDTSNILNSMVIHRNT